MMDLLYAARMLQSVTAGTSGARSPVGRQPKNSLTISCRMSACWGDMGGKGLVPIQECEGHLGVES